MVDTGILNRVMFVEISLLLLAVVIYFSHGVWLYLNQRRLRRVDRNCTRSRLRVSSRVARSTSRISRCFAGCVTTYRKTCSWSSRGA